MSAAVRPEVELLSAPLARGRTGWLLHDPLRHRYFRIGRQALEALGHGGGDDGAVADFLVRNELCRSASAERSAELAARAARRREGWGRALMHRYLFLRVPLWRPDGFLRAALPFVRPLMTRGAAWTFVLLGLLALFLASRRWDVFAADLAQLLRWQGMALYAAALVVLKVCHELGHAFALHRFGGRVPTIGVAFVVLLPILYTDTSDAWRLSSARRRLAVDLAGVAVELAIAVLATLVWVFLPEGPGRTVAFTLAATSWTLSLAVNLNPFMRFDGYHVLADALDMPNLQERAFALARWRMREALFGVGAPPPEPFAPRMRRGLVLYAWATWAYRLVLFTGIALLIYHATFKALGLVLFAVEMAWFVGRPVWNEVRRWRELVCPRRPRAWLPLVPLGGVCILLAAPLDRAVLLPAVLENGRVHVLRAAEAASVGTIAAPDGPVAHGAALLHLRRPDAAKENAALLARTRALQLRSAHSIEGRDRILVTAGERDALARERRAALARDLRLRVHAPANGTLRWERGLRAGLHVAAGEPLGRVVSEGRRVHALASEDDRGRLGEKGTFVADLPGISAVPVRLRTRSHFPQATMDPPELDARHGGPVVAADGRPARPRFLVTFDAAPVALPPGRYRGTVRMAAEPRSYGGRALRRVWHVLVRESGF